MCSRARSRARRSERSVACAEARRRAVPAHNSPLTCMHLPLLRGSVPELLASDETGVSTDTEAHRGDPARPLRVCRPGHADSRGGSARRRSLGLVGRKLAQLHSPLAWSCAGVQGCHRRRSSRVSAERCCRRESHAGVLIRATSSCAPPSSSTKPRAKPAPCTAVQHKKLVSKLSRDASDTSTNTAHPPTSRSALFATALVAAVPGAAASALDSLLAFLLGNSFAFTVCNDSESRLVSPVHCLCFAMSSVPTHLLGKALCRLSCPCTGNSTSTIVVAAGCHCFAGTCSR